MASAYPGDFYPGQVYPSQLAETEEEGDGVFDNTTPALAVFAIATTHRSLVASASLAAFTLATGLASEFDLSDGALAVFVSDPSLAVYDDPEPAFA